MALCRTCRRVIPCHCHVTPAVQIRPGVYLADTRYQKSTEEEGEGDMYFDQTSPSNCDD